MSEPVKHEGEPTPVPALIPPEPRESGSSVGLIAALLLGVGIGGAVMYLTNSGQSDQKTALLPPVASPPLATAPAEPAPSPGLVATNTSGGSLFPPLDLTWMVPPEAATPSPAPAPAPGPVAGGPGVTPPRGGGVPSPLRGQIDAPTGGFAPMRPTVLPDINGSQPSVAEPVEVPMVTLTFSVGDGAAAASSVIGIARNYGGVGVPVTEVLDRRTRNGCLVYVPQDRLDAFLGNLNGVGSLMERVRWRGSEGERRARLASEAERRLDDLQADRKNLLIKYLDDAPEVKEIDEQIALQRKAISALRLRAPGPKMVAVRVLMSDR